MKKQKQTPFFLLRWDAELKKDVERCAKKLSRTLGIAVPVQQFLLMIIRQAVVNETKPNEQK